MTVREMHIELEQSLNQIAAHKTRKYLPEEKDWILTKMQERLIQASLTPRTDGTGGFEINQLYADRIQPLIVSHKPLVPYIDEGKDRYKCFLPADYQYLISNWSYTKVLCEGVTPTIGSTSLTLYALRQNLSGKPTVPYYTTMSVVNGTTVTIPDDLPFFNKYSGYNKKEDVSFLVPVVCQKGGYYWERFGDIVKQGCYLSVVATDTPITPTLTIDGDDKTSVSSQVIPLTYHIGQGTLVSNRMMASKKYHSPGPQPSSVLTITPQFRSFLMGCYMFIGTVALQ